MGNRHLVDELVEVRAKKRHLAEQERILRVRLLQPETNREGDEYYASVRRFTHEELNRTELERRFGRAAVAECVTQRVYDVIDLTRRARPRRAPTQVGAIEALA
jgi:hypothetical protein